MAESLGTLADDEVCHRCGGENVRWSAPSPLWNKVMRGNDIEGDPIYGDLVCIRCFIVLATEAGIDGTWRVSVDPEPEGLIYETPSGRVWDAESGLWVEPTAPSCSGSLRTPQRATTLPSGAEWGNCRGCGGWRPLDDEGVVKSHSSDPRYRPAQTGNADE